MKRLVVGVAVAFLFLVPNYLVKAESLEYDSYKEEFGSDFSQYIDFPYLVDSKYNWAIEYPENAKMVFRSPSGNTTRFEEIYGEYTLQIDVKEYTSPTITEEELVEKLHSYIDSDQEVETETYMKNGITEFALITTKDVRGIVEEYAEYRAFFDNKRIYYVTLSTEKESYNNPIIHIFHQALLDSFKPSLNQNVKHTIDIATEKDGYVNYQSPSGLSMKIPSKWMTEYGDNWINFKNENFTQDISVVISSIKNNDSIYNWIKRDDKYYKETYVNYKKQDLKEIMIAGEKAYERKVYFKLGEKWVAEHSIFLFKGEYKYLIVFKYEMDKNSVEVNKMVDRITKSIIFKTQEMGYDLGFLEEYQYEDKTTTYNVVNEQGNYSVDIPMYWELDISEYYMETYSFRGGGAAFISLPWNEGLENGRNELEKTLEELLIEYSFQEIDIDGKKAYKYSYSYEEEDLVLNETSYLFEYNGIIYSIKFFLSDSTDTKENREAIQNTIESFEFIENSYRSNYGNQLLMAK